MSLRQCLFFFALVLVSYRASAEIPILNYFPQCDYQVLKTTTKSRKLTQQDGRLAEQFVAQAFAKIVVDIREQAKQIGANAILLTDRQFEMVEKQHWTKNRGEHRTVSYSAELIRLCEGDPSLARLATPFDSNGQPQKQLDLGSIGGWQQQIEISLPSLEKRHTPEVTSSLVSLDGGVFGLALGTPYEDALAILGTPTFVMQLEKSHQLIAYGRSLWLVFASGKLVRASSYIDWFSNEFLNLLAFDDRFDDKDWTIQGVGKKSSPPSNATKHPYFDIKQGKTIRLVKSQQALDVITDNYLEDRKGVATSTLVGFSLHELGFALPKPQMTDLTPQVGKVVKEYFENDDREQLTPELFDVQPLARAWIDRTTQLLLFSPHMVIEQTGTDISKMTFLEGVYSPEYMPKDSRWRFSGLSQGDHLDNVLTVLGDEAFHFDDLVEFSGDAFSQNLYFYETSGELRLLSSEISIY